MQDFIEQFILYIATEKGLSTNYQISMRQCLEEFLKWKQTKDAAVSAGSCELEELTDYLSHCKSRGLAAGSIKLHAVALRVFFRYLTVQKIIPKDPTEFLDLPRIGGYLPETLNIPEVTRLLEAVQEDNPLGKRDRAILELLYASGLRVSELCNARLETLSLDEGWIRVVGKGNKVRMVPVGTKACETISRYLDQERPGLVGKKTGGEIFLSVRGKKLTPARIWQLLKEVAKRAGLETNVYPHLLRHSFATHLLANGADLRIIQEMLGHADIATTQVYTHVDQKQLKSVHKRFHPRG
ncbi:MAG: site-specific tyrosine recombinase/integron integrase [Chthoniobacterales bacterium]